LLIVFHNSQGSFNYENTNDLFGDGIFAVDGDKWRQQRKLASYEFSTKVLRDFSSTVFKNKAAELSQIISEKANSKMAMDIQVGIRAQLHFFTNILLIW